MVNLEEPEILEEPKKRQKKATEKKEKVLKKQEPAKVKQERQKRGKSVPEIDDKGDSSGSKVGNNVTKKTAVPKALEIVKPKPKTRSTSAKDALAKSI